MFVSCESKRNISVIFLFFSFYRWLIKSVNKHFYLNNLLYNSRGSMTEHLYTSILEALQFHDTSPLKNNNYNNTHFIS